VQAEIQGIKTEYWETFTADMEHDLYGSQKKIWGLIRRRKRKVNEYVTVTTIPGEAWINYFRQMFNEGETQHQEKPAMAEAPPPQSPTNK